jgi:hypothetical protein
LNPHIFTLPPMSTKKGNLMKTICLLLMSALLLMLLSCESLRTSRISEDFDTTSKGYIKLVRWHEFNKSTLIYVDDSLIEDFQKRVDAAKDVNVADYRIKNIECRPEKGDAEVLIEWDYYIPPSVKLKTVQDAQKWRYIDEKEQKRWVLMTLLPEFK